VIQPCRRTVSSFIVVILSPLLALWFTVITPSALMAQACTPTEPTAYLHRFTLNAPPTSLDPLQIEDATVAFAALQLYDALLLGNTDTGGYEPALARTVTYVQDSTQITYTFVLSPNLRFHDQTPLTADSVVYSSERGTALASPTPWRFATSVQALDEHTVQVTTPASLLPADFLGAIVPAWVILPRRSSGTDPFLTERPVGMGPYRFVCWHEPGISFEVERNPAYVGLRENSVQRILFRYLPESQLEGAILNNEVDVVFNHFALERLDAAGSAIPFQRVPGFQWPDSLSFASSCVTQSTWVSLFNLPAVRFDLLSSYSSGLVMGVEEGLAGSGFDWQVDAIRVEAGPFNSGPGAWNFQPDPVTYPTWEGEPWTNTTCFEPTFTPDPEEIDVYQYLSPNVPDEPAWKRWLGGCYECHTGEPGSTSGTVVVAGGGAGLGGSITPIVVKPKPAKPKKCWKTIYLKDAQGKLQPKTVPCD